MTLPRSIIAALVSAAALPSFVQAQTARDTVLEVTATTSASVPHVTLQWTAPASGVSVASQRMWRRVKGATNWESRIDLSAGALSYPDTQALPGVAYEYSLQRLFPSGTTPPIAYGAIVAGWNLPLVEKRGNVSLLVDQTMSASLAAELAQFERNLTSDGWKVFRHDVPRQTVSASSKNTADWPKRIAELTSIRSIIQTDYNSDPSAEWALVIFGRVPVPYSGNINPDGHPDHLGAWPTDGFYADVKSNPATDGEWTDTQANNTSATNARNDNVPGDGKFDNSRFPGALEMQVGRIDLDNMTGVPTGQTETGLLRQYLVRNHNFRSGTGDYASVARRALIDDNFGYRNGEAFSASGWRAAIGFFGRAAGQVDALDWFTRLQTTPMLFAYGAGSGSYTSASGIGSSTNDFANKHSKAVFTMMFGSYFGDWDSTNNFLRAPLAGTAGSLGLISAWSGRGHIHLHHMALGETVGYAIRHTQNTTANTFPKGDWFQNGYEKGIQINLMGDPTLRLHTVRPPRQLAAASGAGVVLKWLASADTVAGYHVYRADTAAGPYTRLTGGVPTGGDPLGAPVVATTFTDTTASPDATYHYLVKSAKIETSASGTYANQSVGTGISITYEPPGPPTPADFAAVGGPAIGDITLTWTASPGAGYYDIERSTTGGAGFVPVAQVSAPAVTFTDSGRAAGQSYYYRIRAGNTEHQAVFSAEVNTRPFVPTTIEGWRYMHFGTTANAGPAADDHDGDGDSFENLLEWAFGQSPLIPSPLAHPSVGRLSNDDGDYLTLTFIRDPAATGAIIEAEAFDDPEGEWTLIDPLAPANQVGVLDDTPAAGLQTITIKDVRPIGPGGARFMRLRVRYR
jgi:hypothetical protein